MSYYYFISNFQDIYEREEEVNLEEFPQFIPLTADQIEYHLAHPEAKRYEIEHKDDPIPVPSLEEAKRRKIRSIEAYDSSEAVNQFFIGNAALWLDKATRTSLNYTISIEEAKGTPTIDLWYGTVKYTVPTAMAKQVIAAVESYAYACFNVTAQHKANVMALEFVEEVESYDYTLGYPEKLTFNET